MCNSCNTLDPPLRTVQATVQNNELRDFEYSERDENAIKASYQVFVLDYQRR